MIKINKIFHYFPLLDLKKLSHDRKINISLQEKKHDLDLCYF